MGNMQGGRGRPARLSSNYGERAKRGNSIQIQKGGKQRNVGRDGETKNADKIQKVK